ncbi:hypothetical protein LBMAG42_44250 [Deltaproteobacteria bacterium]|nr:hypothetical protein LBMAG42_44250 [Deltaproteobacteria bacterium]
MPGHLMTLRTALTWDGQPAADDERAVVTLTEVVGGLRIDVDAPFHNDPPPKAGIGPVWGLWEHEVVEVFIGAFWDGGVPGYVEVELGPHGHHLVLRLRGVRTVMERELPLVFTATIEGDRWRGVARIPSAWLPSGPRSGWIANATACHGSAAKRRYLTDARLTADKPDFHRPHEWSPLVFDDATR